MPRRGRVERQHAVDERPLPERILRNLVDEPRAKLGKGGRQMSFGAAEPLDGHHGLEPALKQRAAQLVRERGPGEALKSNRVDRAGIFKCRHLGDHLLLVSFRRISHELLEQHAVVRADCPTLRPVKACPTDVESLGNQRGPRSRPLWPQRAPRTLEPADELVKFPIHRGRLHRLHRRPNGLAVDGGVERGRQLLATLGAQRLSGHPNKRAKSFVVGHKGRHARVDPQRSQLPLHGAREGGRIAALGGDRYRGVC